MGSDEPAVLANESTVGNSYVSARGIVVMAAYLVVLCAGMSYCLVALWPNNPPLAITSVNPYHGPKSGDTEIQIYGTGFVDGMQVFLDDVPARTVSRKSEILVTATTPTHEPGRVKIEIATPAGQKASLSNAFTFDSDIAVGNGGSSTSSGTVREVPVRTTLTNCQASSLPLFAWACSLNGSVRLLLIVVIVGALGSLIHVVRSFYWYVGNRNLKASWLLMYFLLPFSGAGLALLFFLIARGVSSQPVAVQSSVDGYAALGALVGMFSQQAVAKLKKIAEGFFSSAEKGKDPALAPSSPTISALSPTQGPSGTKVTITGVGLTGVSRVSFDGVAAPTMTVDNDEQITATVPAHAVGKVDVEAVTTTGQKASLSGAFTYVDPTPGGG
jgi:hypothetical protein